MLTPQQDQLGISPSGGSSPQWSTCEASSVACAERRRVVRRGPDGHCLSVVFPVALQRRLSSVYNISPSGIALRHHSSLEAGKVLAVEVFNRKRNFWHLKVLRVIHATCVADDSWVIGGVFLTPLSDREFESMLGAGDALQAGV
jgi:hypothetical protein